MEWENVVDFEQQQNEANSLISDFLDAVESTYNRLQHLTGQDFRQCEGTGKSSQDSEQSRYFIKWMQNKGRKYMKTIRNVDVICDEDVLLDSLDENIFSLQESLQCENAEIIIAAFADCVAAVAKALQGASSVPWSWEIIEDKELNMDVVLAPPDGEAVLL